MQQAHPQKEEISFYDRYKKGTYTRKTIIKT